MRDVHDPLERNLPVLMSEEEREGLKILEKLCGFEAITMSVKNEEGAHEYLGCLAAYKCSNCNYIHLLVRHVSSEIPGVVSPMLTVAAAEILIQQLQAAIEQTKS